MRKIFSWIVRHTKWILVSFLLLTVLCGVCQSYISVNYDINEYLPPDSASTAALDTMEAEYEGGIPNARILIQDVTIPEALEYKEQLLAVDGVTDVTWLDDAVDVYQPIEYLDPDTVETYYRENAALYLVTIAEDKRIEACDAIREIIGEENAMTGSAVSTAVATTSTVKEIPVIAVFAVAFALLVLILTTTSWAEPFLILFELGIAVVINAGSNLIFGEISFVTNAAGQILQLAVSLDYSVFLLHRFEECRCRTVDSKEAMVEALCSSTSSILSSGLTTVIGFLALCMMRFEIGPDLGLALAKGVAISLITVFTFMPALILLTYKLIDKTRHRSFMPSFRMFGKVVYRVMIPFVCVFLIVMIPSCRASSQNSFYYGSSHIFGADTQLGADTAKIEAIYGKSDTYVLMVPKGYNNIGQRKSHTVRRKSPAMWLFLYPI